MVVDAFECPARAEFWLKQLQEQIENHLDLNNFGVVWFGGGYKSKINCLMGVFVGVKMGNVF